MKNCEDTYQPEYGDENPCELTSNKCIIHEDSIAFLGLPPGTTQEEINITLVNVIIDLRNRIQILENIQNV